MWSSFLKEFLGNISKTEDFGFKFFEKGQILIPFSGLAPSKLNIKRIKGRLCVYIEIV